MADDVQDVWLKEFMELGEETVRKRLSANIWGEDKNRLARQWLELRSTSLAKEANDLARRANDAAKEANDIARTNNIIAIRDGYGGACASGFDHRPFPEEGMTEIPRPSKIANLKNYILKIFEAKDRALRTQKRNCERKVLPSAPNNFSSRV